MNELCRKYNLSEESYKNMIKDGVLSVTLEGWNEVMECFRKHRSSSGSDSEAVYKVMDELNTSRSRVYDIIAHFK